MNKKELTEADIRTKFITPALVPPGGKWDLNIAFRELRVSGYFVAIAQRAINQSSINQKNLGKTLVPVPPLAEQKRIVAKVDELMALCDRLEAQQQERDKLRNDYVQAVQNVQLLRSVQIVKRA